MAFFIAISLFVVFRAEQLFALPLQTALTERGSRFPDSKDHLQWTMDNAFDAPSLFLPNITTINDEKDCIPPVLNSYFSDMSCKFKIVFDDFQENRIPQLLPQIKCVSSLPSLRYRSKRIRTVCEEVRYNLPVVYRNRADDSNMLRYESAVDSVSVACIRSRHPSPILEKMSFASFIEDIE